MTIDMHSHWKPAQLADALRARSEIPRIVPGEDGDEVLGTRRGPGAAGVRERLRTD